jgi:hypothetical protein
MSYRPTLGFFLLLSLAGCSDSDIQLPKVFGNEVPEEVLDQPRVVPTAPLTTDSPSSWPLLGNVPPRPKDFTPPPLINATKTEMENDRDEARQLQQDYQVAPPVLPTSP